MKNDFEIFLKSQTSDITKANKLKEQPKSLV